MKMKKRRRKKEKVETGEQMKNKETNKKEKKLTFI
jgi:hypothetical protein